MADAPKQINWPQHAIELSERMGDSVFEPSVAKYFDQERPGKLLVACSGGADSVFMLCVLVARSEAMGLALHLAHYNHRWRGEESDADAAFVASLGEAFGLPCSIGERPSVEAAFTETTARALRLQFLRETAKQYECDHIVFGHQLDDIIETQLQRVARGCASDGLAAPRPIARFDGHPTHLRPLLNIRAGDIRMALNATSISWREDLSNDDVSIARNALRKNIIPDLSESLGRDAPVGAARSRRLLEEDASALDVLAREKLPEAFQYHPRLSRNRLQELPVALVRRALAEWLSGHELLDSVGAPAMDILIETLRSMRKHFRMSAGEDYIVLDGESLYCERNSQKNEQEVLGLASMRIGEPVILSTGAVVEAERFDVDAHVLDRLRSGNVDPKIEALMADSGEDTFELRSWEPGDRFLPLGAPGSKKLKDWFIDRHIPQSERKSLPLVINASGEVVWVPGFPPAESCKILPSTKQALRLTYQIRNPL